MDFILAPCPSRKPTGPVRIPLSLVPVAWLSSAGWTAGRSDALRARFKPEARLTRRLKADAGDLNFVRLMANSMA